MKSELDLDPWADGEERLAEQAVSPVQQTTIASDEPLPNNLRDGWDELARLDNLRPSTRQDESAIRARREKVARRVFELQQMPQARSITSYEIAERQQAEENRHIDRQQRLDKLAKAYPAVRALIKTATKNP